MTVSEISQIVEKAGRIIYFGLVNPKEISKNQEYQNLYKEYIISSELQEYVKSIAQSLNLYIITIERNGVYLSPKRGSPFTPRLSDIPVLGKLKNKGLFALIMVAIAAYFYPDPQSFQQKGIQKIGLDSNTLHVHIIDKIEQLKESLGDDIIKEDKDHPELIRLLTIFYKMKKVSDINPQSTTIYFIEKTFEALKKQRLVTLDNERYIPTTRFRYQMEEFSNNEKYIEFINLLTKEGE